MTTADDIPAPFTTADIDLSGMPGFILDTEQLRQSELWALSTGDEFKAAVGLWCRAWQQKPPGSLPNDERLLAAWSGTGKRWNKVRDMALRGFVLCSDGRLYHLVLCQDVVRAWAKRNAYRDRASTAAAARWGQHKQCLSNAHAMPSDAQYQVQVQETVQIQGERECADASQTPPPTPTDSPERWRFEQGEPWAQGLKGAGCKVGPNNWPAWKALVAKHGNALVLQAAAGVASVERWPDAVEKAIVSRGEQAGSIGDRVRAKTVKVTT
jgi:hypothetical protein